MSAPPSDEYKRGYYAAQKRLFDDLVEIFSEFGIAEKHKWTIKDGNFVCDLCGHVANEDEGKYLAMCHWSSYSADIHVSNSAPYERGMYE